MAIGPTALKSSYKKGRVIAPLHTGGPVAVTPDGSGIVACVNDQIILTHVESGSEICRFVTDEETVHSLSITPSASHLAAFTASFTLFIFELPKTEGPTSKPVRPLRTIPRAHEAPVHVCRIDPTSTYLASGSADGVVKVWDVHRGFVTHVFKGHGGVVSALAFNFPPAESVIVDNQRVMELITASVDTKIRIFDLTANASSSAGGKPVAVLEGHDSVPRGIDVTLDGKCLVTGGRDAVALVWDLAPASSLGDVSQKRGKGKVRPQPILLRTITVLDRIEALGLLHGLVLPVSKNNLTFYTAGGKGVVQVWDVQTGALVFSLGEIEENLPDDVQEQREIISAHFVASQGLILSVRADQNIVFHSVQTRKVVRHLVGFNDEIVDATFCSPAGADSHLALASNSPLIRVYPIGTNDVRLLSGHQGIVLCMDKNADGTILASGSKDKSVRLWAFDQAQDNWNCMAVCEGHAESVGAVVFSRRSQNNDNQHSFIFTGSQDRTIKMWALPPTHDSTTVPIHLKSLTTHKAHDKDINALDVAPNNRFLASGSQDRTAKIYEIVHVVTSTGVRGEIKLLGICKGHKRSVWTVKFSKEERVLATGSGDKTVKLWNLVDFTCVKTFEGHTNSVLRVDFLSHGMQLVSSASDGLLKLWSVRDEECVATMDNHEDKVWALAVSSDEHTLATGAADSVVTFWVDSTEEIKHDEEVRRASLMSKEQAFLNYVAVSDYRNAISLALAMDQPGRLLSIFRKVTASEAGDDRSADSITGHPSVDLVIKNLPPVEISRLLRHVRVWNTKASTGTVAQTVLRALFQLRSAEEISRAFKGDDVALEGIGRTTARDDPGLGAMVESLIPYSERHMARLDRLIQESYVVDYILGEMDNGLWGDEEGMDLS